MGWLATVVFLDLNGITVMLEDDDAFGLVMKAATGQLEIDQIADGSASQ